MNTEIQKFIDMLKGREDAMKENIKKSVGNEDRVHYIGWLRGIEGSRTTAEYLFKDSK